MCRPATYVRSESIPDRCGRSAHADLLMRHMPGLSTTAHNLPGLSMYVQRRCVQNIDRSEVVCSELKLWYGVARTNEHTRTTAGFAPKNPTPSTRRGKLTLSSVGHTTCFARHALENQGRIPSSCATVSFQNSASIIHIFTQSSSYFTTSYGSYDMITMPRNEIDNSRCCFSSS